MADKIHLYWAWEENPKLFAALGSGDRSTGIAYCKLRGVPVSRLKLKMREINCNDCRKRALQDDGIGREN